ncbi:MAG: exodeoxyribonuclease III [Flavobacteriales bacterium]|mgnify:FL=1|jgi:exodeoxyribonuclease-3|tara:strand:+ start:1176 stop:1931 length:756 start_codon:yes stop_codon:yes gene_type:complete
MKLVSWNLNGIRAVEKKGLSEILEYINADIISFQETKAQDDQVREALKNVSGYHIYSSSAVKKGYSGTAILSKKEPINVTYGMGIDEHDQEGRIISAEYDDFFYVTVYVPNSGNGLAKLDYRSKWDEAFLNYLNKKSKPVFLCGDLNVAHQPIDLKNPKSNYNKTAGYSQLEIDGMNNFINSGFTDTFRHFYPEEIKYSWWSYRFSARVKNIGWRLDYFLASKDAIEMVKDAFILNDVMGSDHCPVGIELK